MIDAAAAKAGRAAADEVKEWCAAAMIQQKKTQQHNHALEQKRFTSGAGRRGER